MLIRRSLFDHLPMSPCHKLPLCLALAAVHWSHPFLVDRLDWHAPKSLTAFANSRCAKMARANAVSAFKPCRRYVSNCTCVCAFHRKLRSTIEIFRVYMIFIDVSTRCVCDWIVLSARLEPYIVAQYILSQLLCFSPIVMCAKFDLISILI